MDPGALIWRLAGGMLVLASASTGLMQAGVLGEPLFSSDAAIRWSAGFLAFVVALLGILLLLHGRHLHAGWRSACERADEGRHCANIADAETDPLLLLDTSVSGGRTAIAAFLILRARERREERTALALRRQTRRTSGHSTFSKVQL